jgi:hypothetical protein
MGLLTTRPSNKLLPTLILTPLLCLIIAPLMLGRRQLSTRPAAASPAPSERAREVYGRIPLSFEANRGQAEESVDFIARGAGYALSLKPTEAVFSLRNTESKSLRMRLVGADAAASAEGAEDLEGKANYFVGDDPSKWRTNVETFGRVRYAEVYSGVDVVYYGNQRQLEYDFRIAPGADARAVTLEFEGADKVELSDGGDLLLKVGDETIQQPKPFVYQEVSGARRAVEGGYVVERGGRVRFELGEYDSTLPLVIDPTLVYSTYLGGSGGDQAWGVAVDSAGSAYIAGYTTSTNFPTASPIQAANAGFQDAFVAKINAAGTALVYSTYLGGSRDEQARGIAIDELGNAYITGFTSSTNFPTANAFQAAPSGNTQDAFVTKINAAGSALIYSTYLGGNGSRESGEAIAVTGANEPVVTGVTDSTNFPVTAGVFQSTPGGSGDAFVTKINDSGAAILLSSYLGGSAAEMGEGIAVDASSNIYITGSTSSTNFPTANAIQGTPGGNGDAFVTKVRATFTDLIYSTYLGGSAPDAAEGIAVDRFLNAYVTGETNSTNFPTANALQPVNDTSAAVSQDAFVTKINAAGNAFVYSTYLGGRNGEVGHGIAADSAGNAYVTGVTTSFNTFPTANAIQCTRAGNVGVFANGDAFVTKINAAGNAFVYSTYIGGSGSDMRATIEMGRGIAIDSSGTAYVAGDTNSADFPVVNPIQSTYAGSDARFVGDAFALKLSDTSSGPASALQFTLTNPTVQEDVTSVTLTVQRTGDTSGPVTVDYATADGTASERGDYTTAVGTLRFAAGETSKTIDVLVNEDSKVEGSETFTVNLSNPTGGATLSCLTAVATVQITDDAVEPTTNVIDDPTIFVGQHYHDFLNRQADTSGLNFWIAQITSCGANAPCVDNKRTNVSQAFFLSIEFQQTGFLVFRFYKESFTDSLARPRGMPRYREFLRDTQEIGRGVVVGAAGWEALLEANKQEFARRWVQRAEFVSQFPVGMTAAAFVDKLFQNAEVTPTTAERNAAIAAFGTGDTEGRANALRSVADSGSVYNRQFNPAFVLSQYIGYLRRNPNDAPEPALDYSGFDFWLAKLNQFSLPGEDVRDPLTAQRRVQRAEMVRAFIISNEYRQRFGQ